LRCARLRALLAVGGAGQTCDLEHHQALGRTDPLAQQSLRYERAQAHHLVSSVVLDQEWISQPTLRGFADDHRALKVSRVITGAQIREASPVSSRAPAVKELPL
jgi:hypothetical protein